MADDKGRGESDKGTPRTPSRSSSSFGRSSWSTPAAIAKRMGGFLNPNARQIASDVVAAADTSGYQPSGYTGGGGGAVAAPVSTLAGLPQSALLAQLIKSGLIKEGMPPEQALAILKFAQMREGVPVDAAELMKLVNADYEKYTGDIMGAGQDWMEQLMGTAYDPNDPNARMFADDPIFSSYAGGMAQLDETSDLNQATDIAWFRKNQEAQEQYYNDMMTAISTGALPIGAAAATSGGGGGGGGYGGGGYGGGGGGGGDGQFGDYQTTVTDEQKAQTDTASKAYENFPGFRTEYLNAIPAIAASHGITDPALIAKLTDEAESLINIEGSKPQDVLAALEEKMIDLSTKTEGYSDVAASNELWTQGAGGNFEDKLNRFMQLSGMQLGDDPTTQIEESFYSPLIQGDNPATLDIQEENYRAVPEALSGNAMFMDTLGTEAGELYQYLDPIVNEAAGGDVGTPSSVSTIVNMLSYLQSLAQNRVGVNGEKTLAVPTTPIDPNNVTGNLPDLATGSYTNSPAEQSIPSTTTIPPTTLPSAQDLMTWNIDQTVPTSTTPPPTTVPPNMASGTGTTPTTGTLADAFPNGTGPITPDNYGGGPRTPAMEQMLQILGQSPQIDMSGGGEFPPTEVYGGGEFPPSGPGSGLVTDPTTGQIRISDEAARQQYEDAINGGGLANQFQEGDPLTDVLSQPGAPVPGSITNTTADNGTFMDNLMSHIPDWLRGDQTVSNETPDVNWGTLGQTGIGMPPLIMQAIARAGLRRPQETPTPPEPGPTSGELSQWVNALDPQELGNERIQQMAKEYEDLGYSEEGYNEFAAQNRNPVTGVLINPETMTEEYKGRLFIDPDTGMLTGPALEAEQQTSYDELMSRVEGDPERLALYPNEGRFYHPQDFDENQYNEFMAMMDLIPEIQDFVNYGEGNVYTGNPDATFGTVYNTVTQKTTNSNTRKGVAKAYTDTDPNTTTGYPETTPFEEFSPIDLEPATVPGSSRGEPAVSSIGGDYGFRPPSALSSAITNLSVPDLLRHNAATMMQLPATVEKPVPQAPSSGGSKKNYRSTSGTAKTVSKPTGTWNYGKKGKKNDKSRY